MSENIPNARLARFLADQLPGSCITISGLRPAGLGRSRDNWIFDLEADGPGDTHIREPLILRSDPEGGLVDTDRRVEFGVLKCLEGSGLPTPTARWLDPAGHAFGRPALIMVRARGDSDYQIVNGPRPLAERVRLARDICDLLVKTHAVDWQAQHLDSVLTDPGPRAAEAELDRWETVLRDDQLEPQPELDFAISELRRTPPASTSTVLVHADYKPGNILFEDGRITALLDWELAHLGDRLEDLGWVTQPLRSREHLILNAWEADDLIEHYERVSGVSVDRDALRWWQMFSTLKTAVMQVSGLCAFVEGRSDEPYRPTTRVLTTLLDDLAERRP